MTNYLFFFFKNSYELRGWEKLIFENHGMCAGLCSGDFERCCPGLIKRCVFENAEIFAPIERLKPLKSVLDVKLSVVCLFLGF